MNKKQLNKEQLKENAKAENFKENAKVANIKKSNVNNEIKDVAKLEQRESRKAFVRLVKLNEISLSSRSKNLIETATNTKAGKDYLSLNGFKVEDAKSIFSVPNILGMYSSVTFEKTQFFFQFKKYNEKRKNGTQFTNLKELEQINTRFCILDKKKFKTSELETLFIKDEKIFIKDRKDVLRVLEAIETLSIFHIVQRANSLRDEKQRLAKLEQRKKEYEKRQKEKAQSLKDKEKAQKEKEAKKKAK